MLQGNGGLHVIKAIWDCGSCIKLYLVGDWGVTDCICDGKARYLTVKYLARINRLFIYKIYRELVRILRLARKDKNDAKVQQWSSQVFGG
jgi:hypothetical protein